MIDQSEKAEESKGDTVPYATHDVRAILDSCFPGVIGGPSQIESLSAFVTSVSDKNVPHRQFVSHLVKVRFGRNAFSNPIAMSGTLCHYRNVLITAPHSDLFCSPFV